ncbi:MAG: hypothetical protein H7A21_19810 [Spirochaetales bacterium]|nr:hypothetical protein [Leptospiraceae bacterium]MCP5483694.1 hypothetical protein [Spirochaetales bacterium]
MEISSKTILNSAESILRDRRQEPRTPGGTSGSGRSEAAAQGTGMQQGALEARVLHLQSNLNRVQAEYSREQARMTYLRDFPDRINADLRFNDEALFPEASPGPIQRGEVERNVKTAMESLVLSLKSIQVEMENLYALNFEQKPIQPADAARLFENHGLKELDPARVARLTR